MPPARWRGPGQHRQTAVGPAGCGWVLGSRRRRGGLIQTLKEGEFLTELARHLVPMRQVMSEAFYKQLIAAIAVPSTDGNPFVASEQIG